MKKILIAGNWKMNTILPEAINLSKSIVEGIKGTDLKVQILICPPFVNLIPVYDIIKGSPIKLGAQNCHYADKGAYTGEISVPMLANVPCSHIIIGHSERRKYFSEIDDILNKKLKAVLNANITPVFCIGETLEDRQNGYAFKIIEWQLKEGLKEISNEDIEKIVIAYEPIWAIGTGIAATTEQIAEAHSFIRNILLKMIGKQAKNMLILYGGSVDATNSQSILEIPDVNGALIGGASLKANTFLSIINTAQNLV
jgi:triosephosphate isomerase (TIM)